MIMIDIVQGLTQVIMFPYHHHPKLQCLLGSNNINDTWFSTVS